MTQTFRAPLVSTPRALAAIWLSACAGADTTQVSGSGLRPSSEVPVEARSEAEPAQTLPTEARRLEPIVGGNELFGGLVVHQPGSIQTTYSAIVQGVDDATDAALRAGYETPARVFPTAHDGAIYIPAGSSPTITKYTVGEGGRLVEGATISFAATGITQVLDGPRMGSDMVAADKAYLLDPQALEFVIWDPSSMTLTGEAIDVSALLTEAFPDQSAYQPRIFLQRGTTRYRDGRMFVPVRWQNNDLDPPYIAAAGMIVIDTETDQVVDLLVDDRLWDTIYTVMTASGDIYLFTGAYGAATNWLTGAGRPGGALRIRSGEERFDPDYYLDLSAALGDRAVTSPVWAGGSSVYVKAFDEEHAPLSEAAMMDPNELVRQESWRYWQVDLDGAAPSREVTEIPWGQTSIYTYEIHPYDRVQRRLFLGMPAADFSRTTLFEANADGRFEESIDVTGELLVLLPLRER